MKDVTVSVLDKGYVRLVDTMGTDLSVVNAARVSYDKESEEFSDRDQGLLEFLIREGHLSPLRHAALTFEIYAPLMVARQWWKYVVASTQIDDQSGWNESSRRYVTENEEFYLPDIWRAAPASSKQGSGGPVDDDLQEKYSTLLHYMNLTAVSVYEAALKDGVAPEQARLFLPAYGMYVRWRWTISLAGVLHFLDERLGHDAQFEIQEYARGVGDFVRIQFPKTNEAWSNK